MEPEEGQPFPCEVFYVCPHREECNTFGKCSPEPTDWLLYSAGAMHEMARD